MAGDVLMTMSRVRLDWSDPSHWSDEKGACRICSTPTNLLDAQGRPCHQSCAENELAAERAGHAGVWLAGPVAEQAGKAGYWVVDERVPTPAQQRIRIGEDR